MRYWTFDANTCRFERAARQVALQTADVAIVNNDNDVHIIQDHRPPTRWASGEARILGGVEFERELFE